MLDASPRCHCNFCRNASVFAEHKQDDNTCTGMSHTGSLLLRHALSVNHSQLIRSDQGLDMHVPPSVLACIQSKWVPTCSEFAVARPHSMHLLTCVSCEGALEQESWAAVAVNHDSQHLVDDWAKRAAQIIKTASSKEGQPTTNGIGSPAGEGVVYYYIGLLLPTNLHAEPVTQQCRKVHMDRQSGLTQRLATGPALAQ